MDSKIYLGDCLEVMKSLDSHSATSLITDPPAGISFMSKKWDSDRGGRKQWISWMAEIMAECRRVCKPGATALVWSIPKTSHWTATALEDAGWEIKDIIVHLFGQGFPKQHKFSRFMPEEKQAKWNGYNTNLKPAAEHWILAMKPVAGTFRENALRFGVGGLNISDCRIGNGVSAGRYPSNVVFSHHPECQLMGRKEIKGTSGGGGVKTAGKNVYGKFASKEYPGKVGYADEDGKEAVEDWNCHPDCAVQMLDEQSGILTSGQMDSIAKGGRYNTYGKHYARRVVATGDSGTASRFFYCAKPSQAERTCNGQVENNHPTVKSINLMRYLCRLTKLPDGGIVLDPFMGTGTICIAAYLEGMGYVGIEQDEKTFKIATERIRLETRQQKLF